MKILFYYPWDGFKKDFLHKDVGLLPSYLAGLNGSVRMLIKGNGVRDDFRNISYQYIGNSYLTGLINLLLEILTQKYNCFLIFHIGLKNLIPVFIMKLIGKKFIVCKCDLNIETAIYITTKHDKISDRIKVVLYKSMFKKIDCLIVETSSVFKILDEKKIDLCIKNLKLLPNGLDDNEFSNLIPIKDKNKKKIITIITRFESDKKAPERLYDIIENWSLPDDWSLHVIGQVPSNLGELIQNKCKKKKNVKIRGVLDRKDLLNHLSDSFMMICYSIEESFCISLIEAAAFNNHIVTTNVGVAEDLSKLYDKISVLDDFDANIFVEKVNLADYMYKDNNIQSINNEIMDCYKWSNIAAKVYQ